MKLFKIFNRANPTPKREEGRAVTYIIKTMPNRILGLDLKAWWDAVLMAKDVNFPRWYPIQEIYDKVMLDGRLYATIQKRKLALLNLDLVYKINEQPDEAVNKFIKRPEFYSMLNNIIDTIFRGYTVIQVRNEKGLLQFDVIPREYIQPELRQLLKSKTDFTGEPLEDFNGIIFVGNGQDLGLLSVAAQYAIYKRNGFADFGQYIERYGQPIQQVTYEGNDPNIKQQVQNGITNMGSGGQIEVPKGVEVKYDNPASSSNNDLFTQFLTSNNEELTILILGQLMTTEKGANYQAGVQRNVEESIFSADRVWMLNILNWQVKHIVLPMFGFNVAGEFMYEETERKDRKTLIEEDTALNNLIQLDKSELYEKYGVKVPTTTTTIA
jgi:phage gp29-like protein